MQKSAIVSVVVGIGLALGGCGGNGTGNSGSDGNGIPNAETGGDSADAAEGVEGNNSSSGDGDGDSGDGDGDSGDGDGDADGTDTNDKFDTLTVPDAYYPCGPPNQGPEFSYLWAANSEQGTITKMDTKTVTEVGRYITRPDSAGNPSRTSVSLSGHVAVANRNGGVTKIYADKTFCQESNDIPGTQTSSNNQFLPWGVEECIAWYKEMLYDSQRPVAWGPGELDVSTCEWKNEELWTSATNGQTIDVYVLDGENGATKEMITIQDVPPDFFGIYGAAVDGNGDFWGSQLGWGTLIRVNREDMTYDTWPQPQTGSWYGMTVDSDGYVWLCSDWVGRFDPQTETFDTAQVGGYTGCMADAHDNGLLWMSDGQGVIGVNRDTLQVEKQWNAAGSYGISIDFEGYVWAVAFGTEVSKIDPDTGQFWTYNGLVGAYTYSDMTGYALSNVGSPNY